MGGVRNRGRPRGGQRGGNVNRDGELAEVATRDVPKAAGQCPDWSLHTRIGVHHVRDAGWQRVGDNDTGSRFGSIVGDTDSVNQLLTSDDWIGGVDLADA